MCHPEEREARLEGPKERPIHMREERRVMSKHKPHGPFGEKVYICRNVFDKAAPILFVYHEHHGDWQAIGRCSAE